MPSNIEMLQIVAVGLEDLKDDVVFVGGAVVELYADNSAASDIRPTADVDCVIDLGSRSSHAKLEEALRKKGFRNDTSKGAPICRYVFKGVKVDVMPSDFKLLGFSNKWYSDGIKNKIPKTLPNGTNIFIFSLEYYLAAKLEAYKDRGGNDLRQSHDFEDIVYILDNYSEIFEIIKNSNKVVKEYLKKEFTALLNNEYLIEGIECALPIGSDFSFDYTDMISDLMKDIAEIDE